MRGERVESKMTAPASESGAPLGCTDDPTGINEHEARALVVEHLAKFNHRLLEGTPFTYDHKTNEWHGIVVTSSNALVVAGFRMKKSDSASSVSSVERTAVTPATTHAGGNTP